MLNREQEKHRETLANNVKAELSNCLGGGSPALFDALEAWIDQKIEDSRDDTMDRVNHSGDYYREPY